MRKAANLLVSRHGRSLSTTGRRMAGSFRYLCLSTDGTWTKKLKDTNPLMSSLLVICLGWCSNFVGSAYGQSVKLLQNMVYSTIQHPPPRSHTLSVYAVLYSVHLVSEGGGGQQFTSWVENTNHSVNVSPVYKIC
jgi:hypothetical protein